MNKCYYRSGIYCSSSSDSSSVTCSLTYSTFADNHALGHNCIFLSSRNKEYEIKSCNIIRNTQVSLNSEATIYTWKNLKIENSCILGNNANCIFYAGSSYTITLSNCTIDKTTNNGCLTIQNTVTKDFILALTHISIQNCHAEYDSFGTLTPIIQHSNKQNHYCTCNIFFCQPRLSDIVSLMCVLIFNFIHSWPL